MSFPDRDTRRDYLAALLTAEGSWQIVYNHQPTSFQGQSPVATVHSGPVEWENLTAARALQVVRMTLLVTNYMKRDDAEDAEDQLDALLATVVGLVNDNARVASIWNDLRITGTEPDYYLVDGEQYRAEVIRVEATVYEKKGT